MAKKGLTPPEKWVKLPRAIMSSSRQEYETPLTVKSGTFPSDISGFWMFVAPAESPDSTTDTLDGNPVFAGDGMIYRIDLNGEIPVLKTKLAKPPSFYADEATAPTDSKYHKLKFSTSGLGRLSFKLGMREDLNTAFLPFQTKKDAKPRLLITNDDGRPFELDSETMEAKTAVGYLKEWRHLMGDGLKLFGKTFGSFPFPLIMSTAHPVYDPELDEVLSVNYGSPFTNSLKASNVLVQEVESLTQAFRILITKLPKFLLYKILTFPHTLLDWIRKILHQPNEDTYVNLVRWDGESSLRHHHLVTPDGNPVRIRQTLHQMAVTEDYMIFLDAAFKFTPDQMFNTMHPFHTKGTFLERMARELLTGPQLPESILYIIKKQDLRDNPGSIDPKNPIPITARKVVIPPEALHFLADYENPNGEITLHLVHNSAACFAEWLREYDNSAYAPQNAVPSDLLGMIAIGQMDICRLGKYKINGETGALLHQQQVCATDNPNTFNLGLYAFQHQDNNGGVAKKIEYMYWMGGGFYPELLTEFIYRMYKNYKHRTIPLDEFEKITGGFKPSNLINVETSTMEIVDSYSFPETHVGLSPQFIPRKNGSVSQTDGYIGCTVVSDVDGCELWLFDAADLREPLCKLGAEQLNFGVTIHTTWVPEINAREATYNVDVKMDFDERVKATGSKDIANLFTDSVYPHFEN